MKNMQESAPQIKSNDIYVINDSLYESPKKIVDTENCRISNVMKLERLSISSCEEQIAIGHGENGFGLTNDEDVHKNGGMPISPPKSIENQNKADDFNDAVQDSGLESAASSWDRTLAEVKEHTFIRLQDELKKAQEELKLRDEEVSRLNRIRSEVESELEELTASLFQEAHNMVREANIRQAVAEKSLKETLMQVDVLSAEVIALKSLVLTSTPSCPNPHLHPQICKDEGGIFKRHRRSPSHFNLKYGRENSPPESPVKENKLSLESADPKETALEVDNVVHKEFLAWKEQPTLDKTDTFIARVYREDINYCLDFRNEELGKQVREAVETGEIFIEAVGDKAKTNFPKKCALLETVRHCQYRLRLGNSDTWHSISHMCRNRVSNVKVFFLPKKDNLNIFKRFQSTIVFS
ncbi:guanine nucleotide exchange factor for Rab-3A-like [Cimex lectularius]|uniref:GDP/GTP exchange factor Sec2 N-terminal domain-containing protein n=1 Tax=Cimex lectularius TaxID=79782 RepID=A0A8I6SNV9_CIMLE|nr:guanine nucleotide exchange factor for Rab-3A-like [Cimex lectularius]